MSNSTTPHTTARQAGSQPLNSEEQFQNGKGGARICRNFCWKNKHVVKHQKITANHTQNDYSAFPCIGKCKSLSSLNWLLGMHLNYLGPVSRVQNISCFSSFWIPLRAHLWVPLPGLVVCWWATLVVYWNGRQCSFFIGMHTHRNVRTDTAHATQMLSARSSLQRALLLQLQEKLRPERAFLMPLSYLERHWHCFPLPVLGPLQLGISHFVDPLFTAAPPAPGC